MIRVTIEMLWKKYCVVVYSMWDGVVDVVIASWLRKSCFQQLGDLKTWNMFSYNIEIRKHCLDLGGLHLHGFGKGHLKCNYLLQ